MRASCGPQALRGAAPLAVNDALQAAMFPADIEFLPDLWTTALDEVLAIGVGGLVMDDELGNLLSPVVTTMAFGQPIDCGFHLKQFGSRAVFWRKVEQ